MPSLDNSKPIPILIIGDGPDAKTGLARIGHDLAYLLCSMPEFRVGYLGRNSVGRARYPWANYSFPIAAQWGESYIQQCWDDLRQGQVGIIMTVWDASRLLWFGDSDNSGLPTSLVEFLGPRRTFQKWGYFMQDSEGIVPGCLPHTAAATMVGYDRVCIASKWGFEIAKRSMQHDDLDWLPHGINRNTFQPNEAGAAAIQSAWGIENQHKLVGCVMANQARKHWPTVLEAVAASTHKPRLWLRTDTLVNYWHLPALLYEYGLNDRVIIEDRHLSDTELAMRYSACDATIMISGGEGFCYPVAESLSCGTHVVTGSYGAQAELVGNVVSPVYASIDTVHNVRRAYYGAVHGHLDSFLGNPPSADSCVERVAHLDWKRLSKSWEKYFRRGIQCVS